MKGGCTNSDEGDKYENLKKNKTCNISGDLVWKYSKDLHNFNPRNIPHTIPDAKVQELWKEKGAYVGDSGDSTKGKLI